MGLLDSIDSTIVLGLLWVIEAALFGIIGCFWVRDPVRTANQVPGILMFLIAIKNIFLTLPYLSIASFSVKEKIMALFFEGVIIAYQICLIIIQRHQAKLMAHLLKDANNERNSTN